MVRIFASVATNAFAFSRAAPLIQRENHSNDTAANDRDSLGPGG